MFKFGLVLILVLVAVSVTCQKVEDDLNLNTDEKKQVATIEADCIQQTGADLGQVQKFDKGEFADNKELRNFYKCLLTSFGVMDAEGRIVRSKINFLVPNNLRSKAEHCFNREKGEPSEIAYETYKCYIKTIYVKQ